ncbi:hypothetical protein OROMI_002898 [Orobanche minor]
MMNFGFLHRLTIDLLSNVVEARNSHPLTYKEILYKNKPSQLLALRSVGACFVILNEYGTGYHDQACEGEVGLFPHYMGAVNHLLNADHDEVFFKGTPMYKGMG